MGNKIVRRSRKNGIPRMKKLTNNSYSEKEQKCIVSLIIRGQGTVPVTLKTKEDFAWVINDPVDSGRGIKLMVTDEGVFLSEKRNDRWIDIPVFTKPERGIDNDKDCVYWFSIDSNNLRISYGKGEMRLNTELFDYKFNSESDYLWVNSVQEVEIISNHAANSIEVWRDPITIEPPLLIVETDKITMTDVALINATVPENLTTACQVLYGNISGTNFQLNTPDFPDFVAAIEESIRNPEGWCYNKLKEKACEFGSCNEEETYLRITLGVDQGNSPGIPYVMEIWPPGHYSPIHNHAGANAIIRVLSGQIKVSLFAMLSPDHTTPFAERVFGKDSVTWLSPGLNQVHQLKNPYNDGPTCITIQCYRYGNEDTDHYEFFDYISDNKIEPFVPNSDMGFLEFKALMKEEWEMSKKEVEKEVPYLATDYS
ncbi:MAG: cysteine dioxygenase family protein [Bacteroidales bacterium]|jgi:predicted metal-dependent enzyme (double-stranded beta helix superfamily)|nr:cysteine dioxygenase family protein [Bacteroidales bacterium]